MKSSYILQYNSFIFKDIIEHESVLKQLIGVKRRLKIFLHQSYIREKNYTCFYDPVYLFDIS